MSRVVSYFSCGAASAVATKLALQAACLIRGEETHNHDRP